MNTTVLADMGIRLIPRGDLIAMEKTKKMLATEGLLFLNVPVGIEAIWWNAHRVYGPLRLPLLLAGWEMLDSFGFQQSNFFEPDPTQPVFVLRVSH